MQAIKNAPAMLEHQQGAQQIEQFKSNTKNTRNQEVIFTENSLCPACKRGHLTYKRQIMAVHPITYIIRNACDRCGEECVSYKEDNTKDFDVRAIIAARIRRKMSREELADLANVRVYYVRNLEERKGIVNLDVVSRVAATLELNLKDLIKPAETLQDDRGTRKTMLLTAIAERERQGLSKKDLAEKIGISTSWLKQLETLAHGIPSWKTLQKLYVGLGLEMEVARCK